MTSQEQGARHDIVIEMEEHREGDVKTVNATVKPMGNRIDARDVAQAYGAALQQMGVKCKEVTCTHEGGQGRSTDTIEAGELVMSIEVDVDEHMERLIVAAEMAVSAGTLKEQGGHMEGCDHAICVTRLPSWPEVRGVQIGLSAWRAFCEREIGEKPQPGVWRETLLEYLGPEIEIVGESAWPAQVDAGGQWPRIMMMLRSELSEDELAQWISMAMNGLDLGTAH